MPPLTCKAEERFSLQPGHALCLVRSFADVAPGVARRAAIHVWLRKSLATALRVSEASLTFARTGNGKPWLPQHADVHFNLSHSGSLAAVAISGERPVGVDIERVAGRPEMKHRIAARFFHPDELAWLTSHTEDYLLHFTRLWSLKEAWLKMLGTGLTQPLSSFRIVLPAAGRAEVYAGGGQETGSAYYQTIDADGRYCLACAMAPDALNPPANWRIVWQR